MEHVLDTLLGGLIALAGVLFAQRAEASRAAADRAESARRARDERQAATLRETQQAIGDFVRAWSPLWSATGKGTTVDVLAPEHVAGPPSESHRRLQILTERIADEGLRQRLHAYAAAVMTPVLSGPPKSAQEVLALGVQIHKLADDQSALITDIGSELRRIEGQ